MADGFWWGVYWNDHLVAVFNHQEDARMFSCCYCDGEEPKRITIEVTERPGHDHVDV